MAVAHLSAEEMAAFASTPADDPARVADTRIRKYAEREGGRTLTYWKLELGRIWGDPVMMTPDEAAARLGWTEAEAEEIRQATFRACGYA